MTKTTFFKSCLGVFQGGGCRAAAFVGAYEEAVARGVSFTEIAGTSAGSIMAALLGAGASPSEVREAIIDIDYNSFLAPPDRRSPKNIIQRLVPAKYQTLLDLAFNQGFHSPRNVRAWVEQKLQKLLPDANKPITFDSLLFPTYIISTDIRRAEAKVWSQKTTPKELVADAVEASCAIPFFYQPVNNRYIDGGALSNLPSFVFSGRQSSERMLASRILAFTLLANEEPTLDWNTRLFLSLMADAIVDGSQKIQLSLQPNVYTIPIPTGNIKATDFHLMTPDATQTLIRNGQNATQKFFREELQKVRSTIDFDGICYDLDESYTRIAESLDFDLERVVVADHNTDWVYALFPTLFCWRARGVRVDVLLPQLGDKKDGAYRRALLRALGANVVEIPSSTTVPMRATIITPKDKAKIRAIVGVNKSTTQTIDSVLYEGYLHESSISALQTQLDTFFQDTSTIGIEPPKLLAGQQDLLIKRLKSVGQYAKVGIDVSIQTISLDRLVSLTRFVREYKYRQIRHLMHIYSNSNIALFDPAYIALRGQQSSLVTPPVVEASGEHFILVEGSTRATFSRDEGKQELKCIVVRGVEDPLPSAPIPFRQVRVVGRTLPTAERYEQFNYGNFRSIERSMHPFDSLN